MLFLICRIISYNSKTVRNLESAKVSTIGQLSENLVIKGEYNWKVDLKNTSSFWNDWFLGLSEQFINLKIPKILVLANVERMDNYLTIAHMQGKFKLVCLNNDVGHLLHEDDPKGVSRVLKDFITMFNIPLNIKEIERFKKEGFGKFNNFIKLNKL